MTKVTDDAWYYNRKGVIEGPFSADVLGPEIASGQRRADGLVRHGQTARWTPISQSPFAQAIPTAPQSPKTSKIKRIVLGACLVVVALIGFLIGLALLLPDPIATKRDVVGFELGHSKQQIANNAAQRGFKCNADFQSCQINDQARVDFQYSTAFNPPRVLMMTYTFGTSERRDELVARVERIYGVPSRYRSFNNVMGARFYEYQFHLGNGDVITLDPMFRAYEDTNTASYASLEFRSNRLINESNTALEEQERRNIPAPRF